MSIVTKTGDKGDTGLMYNRRVSKCDPRVEAYGAVDELTSALGMARALTNSPYIAERIFSVQKDLIALMGELATKTEDLERFKKDGFSVVTTSMTAKLDAFAKELEGAGLVFNDWVIPGKNPSSAALDVARTTCRRAERQACHLHESKCLENPEIIVFLNRLSDVLWLMARRVEADEKLSGPETIT
ncbi:MAG: cob(I)yrinic acid a,c-diamide adenosyltransferase [Limisphaerales bacterium]